jgi:hypothetical protein
MSDRWKSARENAANPAIRRELLYGPFVADVWDELKGKFGERIGVLEGMLLDTHIITKKETLERLVDELEPMSHEKGPNGTGRWTEISTGAIDSSLPPYAQGYALATSARDFLGCRTEPFVDLREVLETLGISLSRSKERSGSFRSAVIAKPDGSARVLHDGVGTSRVRFSISAALGRLLAERTGGYFGAVHGSFSRWEQTRRASAFAAEFLLPRAGLRALDPTDLDEITEAYGISKSAARWHVHNRMEGLRDRLSY